MTDPARPAAPTAPGGVPTGSAAPGSHRRRRAGPTLVLLALVTGLAAAACSLLPDRPRRLTYRLAPSLQGVRVTLRVEGGPSSAVWVGVGDSDLGLDRPTREVTEIAAVDADGAGLPVRRVGTDAWRIDRRDRRPLELRYRVALSPIPSEMYHRASTASSRHLILLGSDILAQLYASRRAVEAPPSRRPSGALEEAIVEIDATDLPPGWRVVSAEPEVAPGRFRIREDLPRAVFAAGPYHVEALEPGSPVSVAIHQDWRLARRELVNHSRQLLRVLSRELGPPPGDPPLLLFTPLPPQVAPSQGMRTAGMVWDRTMILFAGASARTPGSNSAIREMMAIFLGHELFHLYVPWGLPVARELSWLSEGWANHMGRRAAASARLLSRSGNVRTLRSAFDRYIRLGGSRAGSLQSASERGEAMRDLLYVRGELVFRILSLEWRENGGTGSFDSMLWRRLRQIPESELPVKPDQVSSILTELVAPVTVRRYVNGDAPITLAQLDLERR